MATLPRLPHPLPCRRRPTRLPSLGLALFLSSFPACDALNNAVAPLPLVGHSDEDAIEAALLQADVTNSVYCDTAAHPLCVRTTWLRAKHWLETYSAMPLSGPLLETTRPTRGSRRGFTVWFDDSEDPTVTVRLLQFCAIPSCAPPTDLQVEKAFLFYVAHGIDLVASLNFRP